MTEDEDTRGWSPTQRVVLNWMEVGSMAVEDHREPDPDPIPAYWIPAISPKADRAALLELIEKQKAWARRNPRGAGKV